MYGNKHYLITSRFLNRDILFKTSQNHCIFAVALQLFVYDSLNRSLLSSFSNPCSAPRFQPSAWCCSTFQFQRHRSCLAALQHRWAKQERPVSAHSSVAVISYVAGLPMRISYGKHMYQKLSVKSKTWVIHFPLHPHSTPGVSNLALLLSLIIKNRFFFL